MIYYAIFAVVILALVFLIVKWFNLPKTIEQRRKQAEEAEARRQQRREDWENRPGLFGRRRRRLGDEIKPDK